VRRFRGTSKAPLAVAAILAVPLFFVGLMSFTLKVDKPSQRVSTDGKVVFGDPTKATVGKIYLLALAVAAVMLLVGVLGRLLRTRLAVIVPAVAAIVLSVLLQLPLNTWAAEHTARYPLGTDNIPDGTPAHPVSTNLILKGEWEKTAKTTALQIGLVTIGLAIAAILLTVALDIRRRRGVDRYPPVAITGEGEASPVVDLEVAE
jgi:hypothetical protein